jgi:uncharacterized protein YecE (DUF72 family)
MKIYIGTSGYSYKEWKGSFYPQKISPKEMLGFYSQHFTTCELNGTFYKMPSATDAESWASQVPDSFRFVMKAPQTITHRKRLRNVEDDTKHFVQVASHLGAKAGPLLFQLPPNMKKDVERLDTFLSIIDDKTRVALEFRHESWLDEEVFTLLRKHGCALCVADAEDLPAAELTPLTSWGYLRLRREAYTDAELRKWLKKLNDQGWKEAFVFFRHEDLGLGPELASRLIALSEK